MPGLENSALSDGRKSIGASGFYNRLFTGSQLPHKYQCYHYDANDVRRAGRVDQHQAADDREDALRPVHKVKQVSRKTGRYAENTDQGSQNDARDLQGTAHIHQDHHRIECQDVGNDECRDRKLCSIQCRPHRVCLRNCCACIRCQGYGRCDVRNDSEVKYEEMRRDGRYTHSHKDRRACRCHDAVICCRRNTHSKDDTAQHGQHERDKHAASCQGNDTVDQDIGQTCHGDDTRNDTRNSAGGRHADGASGTCR